MMLCVAILFLFTVECRQLEYVSIVFRHGDRTPYTTFPTDLYKEDSWPQGYGQLTLLGMKEEYNLGQLFKKRYIDTGFMSSNYTRSEIYVRSTDFDRTIMSAQCVLAGLYPPEPDQEFVEGLQWQPIPVHTVPAYNDSLLRAHSSTCNLYQTLSDNNINDKNYSNMQDQYQSLFDSLSLYTNVTVNLSNIWSIQDTLFVEYVNNRTMPSWFNTTLLSTLNKLVNFVIGYMFNTDQKRKLSGGVWANQVLNDMNDKVNKQLDGRKMYLYSAHDTTVSIMLGVFGLFNNIQPPYSSAFIIELYSNNSNYYVKFLYRNDTSSPDIIELVHPECTEYCPLETLNKIMEPYRLTPTQWNELCNNSPSNGLSTVIIGLSVGVAFISLVLLLIVMLIPICLLKIRFLKKNSYKPIIDNNNSL